MPQVVLPPYPDMKKILDAFSSNPKEQWFWKGKGEVGDDLMGGGFLKGLKSLSITIWLLKQAIVGLSRRTKRRQFDIFFAHIICILFLFF